MSVYEVVRSRIRTGSEERMLELRPRMIAAVRSRFPELQDAHLIQLDDGSWLDVVRWGSRESAERAAAAMQDIPEAAAMMELIEEIVSFEHGVERAPIAA
jgi:hypothetical protein